MDIDLTGKNALVCGASSGLGAACALELAKLGCQVTLLSRSEEKLAETLLLLPNSSSHAILTCDLEDRRQVDALCNRLQADELVYHILVNNSGGPAPSLPTETKQEDLEKALQAHLFAAINLANTLIPRMKSAKYGRIVNITSVTAKQPVESLSVSNTVRAAVSGWSKTLSIEVAKFGITVNNVLPGYTETKRLNELFSAAAAKQNKPYAEVTADIIGEIPMGRFGRPEEFAAVVAFLASPAASFVTGASIPVCGGWLRSTF